MWYPPSKQQIESNTNPFRALTPEQMRQKHMQEIEEAKKVKVPSKLLKDFQKEIKNERDYQFAGTDSDDDKQDIIDDEKELIKVLKLLQKGQLEKAYDAFDELDTALQDVVPQRLLKFMDQNLDESILESLDEIVRAKDKYPEIDKIKAVMKKKGIGFYTSKGKIMVNPKNEMEAKEALNKAFGGDYEKKTAMQVKGDKRQSISDETEIEEAIGALAKGAAVAARVGAKVAPKVAKAGAKVAKAGAKAGAKAVKKAVKGTAKEFARGAGEGAGAKAVEIAAKKKKKSISDETEIEEGVRTAFKGADKETSEFQAKLKRFGYAKTYIKMMQDFKKNAEPGDGLYFRDKVNGVGFEVHPVADMMMGSKIKNLGDSGKLSSGETVRLIAIKEDVELDEMSAKAHYNKMVQQDKLGGKRVSPIDRKRFPDREREGLEGPYRVKKSGLIYYYDKKAGKYYDPQADMYLQVRDIMEETEDQKPLITWMDKFEKALKSMGSSYAKVDPVEALKLYYRKMDPKAAAKKLK